MIGYEAFRDQSGSWVVEIQTHRDTRNSVVSDRILPDPEDAYRAAVFVERFGSLDSPVEIEVLRRALREIASRVDQ
jgi:hypothetical protein